MDLQSALGIARILMDNGASALAASTNPAIPLELHRQVLEILERDQNIEFEPVRMVVDGPDDREWLDQQDRSEWHYWPTLRTFLLTKPAWTQAAVRSLDDTSDRVLARLSDPAKEAFDKRGLVIGYVQSGKTANYTSLIAKAADVGYKLIVVLSGIENMLRRQTQLRLEKELIGRPILSNDSVLMPPMGKQWHTFTTSDLQGDFRAGNANYAALQGSQPVLLVIKKNGNVLRRLHKWLDQAPGEVHRQLPILVIDDEADLASVDTRGTYLTLGEERPEDYEEPSKINGLIRDLLRKFRRRAYVAYTATPYANILIPHDNFDPTVEEDLYPKDFIVDLPKPEGYFGAEECFGLAEEEGSSRQPALDIIRDVADEDVEDIREDGLAPTSLQMAIVDFVLGAAGRAARRHLAGQSDLDFPATMLVHGSSQIAQHQAQGQSVERVFNALKDEWRYQKNQGVERRLRERWETSFRPLTHQVFPALDLAFRDIELQVGPILEAIRVVVINYQSDEKLDYERDPRTKVIAVGGNKMSRGLTLEGLLTSYFFRSSTTYDTLMQMGRWFGFRAGYQDLTRIYMPSDLAGWFSQLAAVETELRQDIRMYEVLGKTPRELGLRIRTHPGMLVTSRLKQRFSRSVTVEQNYAGECVQHFRFPFDKPQYLADMLTSNFTSTRRFLGKLGQPQWGSNHAMWRDTPAERVLQYISDYQLDPQVALNLDRGLLIDYINKQNAKGELVRWTIAIRGREKMDPVLGEIDLGLDRRLALLGRNRLKKADTNSLKGVTNPGDEEFGLSAAQVQEGAMKYALTNESRNARARLVRPATEGLLLLYPISRSSGHEETPNDNRQPLFEDPKSKYAADLLTWAISFPRSNNPEVLVRTYSQGTVDWITDERD